MNGVQKDKLEKIEGLLRDLQNNFITTYKEIHSLMNSIVDERDIADNAFDEELNEDLMKHMEELFEEEQK